MASTYSDLKFELIGTGEQSGTWGVTTNTNLGTAIEEAITGSADVTFASGTVTLTLTNTNASQTARNLRLNLTGTSGGAQDLIVPTIEKFYLVNNGCADAITVKNSTGTGVAVPAGKAMLVFNNGTDVVEGITYITALETSTATIGTLTLTNALVIAQGGTGATTADTALDNLGGTTVGKAVFKASTATAAQQAMDTEVGVDVQAYDAGLTDIAGLAVTDGNIIVGDGTNWVAESGATARTSLGLGSIATQASSSVTITGGSITGITDLAVADGGTGASSFTADNVLLGNGTSAFQVVAPGTSGNVLTSDGTSWVSSAAGGGGFLVETFYSPGTWTKPAGLSQGIRVTVVGGGGGGVVAPPSQASRGPGGMGGLAIAYIPAPSIPGPVPVTVGAGGNTSAGGGTSSFGTFASATGGSTSNNNQYGNPGSGSTTGTAIKTGTTGHSFSNVGGYIGGNNPPAPIVYGPGAIYAAWNNTANGTTSVYAGGNAGRGGGSPTPNSVGGGGYVLVEAVG
jgi:hypothetical protein